MVQNATCLYPINRSKILSSIWKTCTLRLMPLCQHQPFERFVNCHTKKRQKQQTEEHERKRSERLIAIRKRDPAEMVRFLVHNTVSLYSVFSLLAFLRSDPNRSIRDYYHSNIKQDVFGDVSLPFLEDVYENLSSYYRHLGCYPKVDGKRVDTCLACGEKHSGCICPKLSPEFCFFLQKTLFAQL